MKCHVKYLVKIQKSGDFSKKRVLLIVRWPVGGIRTFIRYIYRDFDYANWQITILAPDDQDMQVLMSDLSGLGVRYVLTKANPSPATFVLSVACELVKGSYDLIHSHGFSSGLSAALPAWLIRTPHLMTSHDVLSEKQFAGVKGCIKRLIMRFHLRLIDAVHSVSQDAQNNLLAFFPDLASNKSVYVVIPNGIETERFDQASPRDLRLELGLKKDIFLIGFLGRFMSQKGFRYLVTAIDLLRSTPGLPKQPLVLTFGEGCFIREEKQAVQEKGLDDYIRFLPFAPNVAGTIKGLDVVVMPSLWEACPLQPMETFICGTPFIGTDCIGLREVLRDTPAKIIPKADSAALAQAMLSEMAASSKDICMAFRGEAKKRFDVAETKRKMIHLYEKLV